MNAKKGQDAPQDFESGMTRLETNVVRFDEGDLPLDEMEKLFTEGMDLVKRCGKRLEAVEARLKTAEEMKDDARQEDS